MLCIWFLLVPNLSSASEVVVWKHHIENADDKYDFVSYFLLHLGMELKHITLISDSVFSTTIIILFSDARIIFLFNWVCVCVCVCVSQRPEATRRVL